MTYVVESRGEKLVVWGDLMELGAIQFAAPEVTIVYDQSAVEAARIRPRAYAEAADGRYWIAASHLPFPGIGHVTRDRGTYRWVPIVYDAR